MTSSERNDIAYSHFNCISPGFLCRQKSPAFLCCVKRRLCSCFIVVWYAKISTWPVKQTWRQHISDSEYLQNVSCLKGQGPSSTLLTSTKSLCYWSTAVKCMRVVPICVCIPDISELNTQEIIPLWKKLSFPPFVRVPGISSYCWSGIFPPARQLGVFVLLCLVTNAVRPMKTFCLPWHIPWHTRWIVNISTWCTSHVRLGNRRLHPKTNSQQAQKTGKVIERRFFKMVQLHLVFASRASSFSPSTQLSPAHHPVWPGHILTSRKHNRS